MITKEELNAVKLSATKKDFYQIWNEILDYAQKISNRWDPQNTNESDPGIVLLKVATALADKLNFNVDVNALEPYMPTAAQIESMRRLTEMQGYNMKYYRSATTTAKISFNLPSSASDLVSPVTIDKFTNLKDIDDTINYVTLENVQISKDVSSAEVKCIEGELVECETDNDNIISLLQLDDNNKYYLPEVNIAENGIFVSNITDGYESTEDWDKVDNLNTQRVGKRCYKFGFDSRVNLPYIQFPADISNIIEDGIKIKYIRTNGVNGNISKNTLYKMEKPLSWQVTGSEEDLSDEWHTVDNYTITNPSAAKNGSNIETIDEAYNSFKKTIGTFDTLVTCRDYMNKIYQLTVSDTDTIPLVSNIIVSDIRDDINRANIVCSFGSFGIEYNTVAKKADGEALIKPFDLIFYPFKTIYGLNTKDEYTKSFKYDDSNILEIKHDIEEQKTIAHNIVEPEKTDIACIKNYYNLKATITTTYKVNAIEQADILSNVYSKLFETFNMRKLDFGEELSDDMIISTIENADPRIKNVGWQNPDIETRICLVDGSEEGADNHDDYDSYYNRLILNNVLAGRISAFNYNEGFKPEYNEASYSGEDPDGSGYKPLYPENIASDKSNGVAKIKTEFTIEAGSSDIKLGANEVVQFRAKNLKTVKTFPAYVNYFLKLNTGNSAKKAIPATMRTVKNYLDNKVAWISAINSIGGTEIAVTENTFNTLMANTPGGLFKWIEAEAAVPDTETAVTSENFAELKEAGHLYEIIATGSDIGYLVDASGNKYALTADTEFDSEKIYEVIEADKEGSNARYVCATAFESGTQYYCLVFDRTNLFKWQQWFDGQTPSLQVYWNLGYNASNIVGELVDINREKYIIPDTYRTPVGAAYDSYYVPQTWDSLVEPGEDTEYPYGHTENGLGRNGDLDHIPEDTEYKLKTNEYLCINYTHASSTEDNSAQTIINEIYTKDKHYINGRLDPDYKVGIIKPNFDLNDSTEYRSEHKYTKTTGFEFPPEYPVPGMFSLGTDQQIEARDFIEVHLNKYSNLYWTRNDEVADAYGQIEFTYDEENGTAYTLKEGEYLYYTDINKNDIAYYGSGTKIKKSANTPRIYKTKEESTITAEDIANLGLSAAIPWRTYNLGLTNAELVITEYQYINLTEGNTLLSYTLDTHEQSHILNNDYKYITDAQYILDSGDDKLPRINITEGFPDWEVRTKLELNTSPTKEQTLRKDEKGYDTITLYDKDDIMLAVITPDETITTETLAIKANKVIQSSTTITNVGYTDIFDTSSTGTYYDCQIKVFATGDVKDNNDNTINLGNFGDGNYTKLDFTNSGDEVFTALNILIPDEHFGLIMMYYNTNGGECTAEIGCTVATGTAPTPSIFNYQTNWETGKFAWWSDSPSGHYALHEGINIVYLDSSCSLNILSGTNHKGNLIIGNLDLIHDGTGEQLNSKLSYKKLDKDNAYYQLLADIQKLDPDNKFYYNNIPTNDIAIELNADDSADNLKNPFAWFSYNNVNNKFVISEINADTLSTGVIIGKNSKI